MNGFLNISSILISSDKYVSYYRLLFSFIYAYILVFYYLEYNYFLLKILLGARYLLEFILYEKI